MQTFRRFSLTRVRSYDIFQDTPEPSTSESVVSDDEGVLISKEEVEESINRAVVRTHASLFGVIDS